MHFLVQARSVKGEFHCSECGYGVTVYRALPVCPMCGGEEWEQSAWSPLSRARSVASSRRALEPEQSLHLGPRPSG